MWLDFRMEKCTTCPECWRTGRPEEESEVILRLNIASYRGHRRYSRIIDPGSHGLMRLLMNGSASGPGSKSIKESTNQHRLAMKYQRVSRSKKT
jgi:hypothetical protein